MKNHISFRKSVARILLSSLMLLMLVPVASAGPSVQKYLPEGGFGGNFEFKVNPGESVFDYILLQNNDDLSGVYELNLVDAAAVDGVDENGEATYFSLKNHALTQEGVGKWGKLEENKVVLGPKESKVIKITFDVSADAKEGRYAGGLNVLQTQSGVLEADSVGNGGVAMLVGASKRIFIEVVTDEDLEFVPRIETLPEMDDSKGNRNLVGLLAGLMVLVGASVGVYLKRRK